MYLEIEKVSVLVGLESEDIGIVLACDSFEMRIEGKDNNIYFFQVAFEVHPACMVLVILILSCERTTV
jgi:hypothetical protein